MMVPIDMASGVDVDLGGPLEEFDKPLKRLSRLIENDAHGVYKSEDFVKNLTDLSTGADPINKQDLENRFTIYTNVGSQKFFGAKGADKYLDGKNLKTISDAGLIIGKDFDLKKPVLLFSSKAPFLHPANRHTKRIETFLNSMPNVVVSSLVPYLDVEFQVSREPNGALPPMSQLRFLLGNVDVKNMSSADKAMLQGKQVTSNGIEVDYAGVEMFTSPVTMVSPRPNAQAQGDRYNEILDPFRPFASIENFSVTVTPAVGTYSYKKAHLQLKLHDRSRLAEISDLLRPRSYSNVTIWVTYGWRAPVNTGNLYFEYINNNMMVREAYGIINTSFNFDQVGQVSIGVELYTKGVSELRSLKISDTRGDAQKLLDDIQQLSEDISSYRKKLKLDPPEGINKEIRIHQVLDSAEIGEFPDWKPSDVSQAIDTLKHMKDSKDPATVKKLIDALNKLYKQDQSKTKFDLKARYETKVADNVRKKFQELISGPDPFLPGDHNSSVIDSPLLAEIAKYKNDNKNNNVKEFNRGVVSFGKLFSVFVGQCMTSADAVDELQLLFYVLNDQCGPVSGHSIAEFPIDLQVFLDQYRDHVIRRGGEKITLEEFLRLVINAQVLDNRAIGYGLRSYYEPYDPKNKDASILKNKEKDFENALSAMNSRYGPFKKPVIEMYVETTHERPTQVGDSDVLLTLAYSAKDATMLFDNQLKGQQLRKIMRIHVYDKQANPHKAAATILKNANEKTFIEVGSTDYAKKFIDQKSLTQSSILNLDAINNQITLDAKTGKIKLTQFSNVRQIKDVVSKMVPSITYGANGSTIVSANLSSKADALLSTVNMLRSNSAKNVIMPNGSGVSGLPLRVIPATLSMSTLGCPLAQMAQIFFVDFNTGTSIDNLYVVTGLTHTITPGKFETQWTWGYYDAYGVFEGAPNVLDVIKSIPSQLPTKK